MARGGKRPGAGRKLGVLNTRTRLLAEQAMIEGKTPLEVMLENMRHFHKVALDAEAVLEGLTMEEFAGKHGDMTPAEQFKMLLAEVKKTAGLRQAAQECARDAAPFLHPRLANVQHTGAEGGPIRHEDVSVARDELISRINSVAARTGTPEGSSKPH